MLAQILVTRRVLPAWERTCSELCYCCWAQILATGAVVSLLPGVAVYYSDSLAGLPAVFEQLMETAPALHKIIVFLHIRQARPALAVLRNPALQHTTPATPSSWAHGHTCLTLPGQGPFDSRTCHRNIACLCPGHRTAALGRPRMSPCMHWAWAGAGADCGSG